MTHESIIIIGAGHAGGTAAALLRQRGHKGPIVLVGDEPLVPYQRPPLSKAWLKGEIGEDDLILKPRSFYDEQGIELCLSARAVEIDREAKTVSLSDGRELSYGLLILATGARARKLPVAGAEFQGVLELRTAADAEKLKKVLAPGKRLAVIGGGYVGLEAAASARALGAEVVVIEREARLLPRVAGGDLSAFFHRYHETKGVKFEVSQQVAAIEGEAGRVTGVRLSGGEVLPCDAALIGVAVEHWCHS